MDIITITFIAVGLAMDAFAVSVTSGASFKEAGGHGSFKMAASFGIFQAVMPVIGWLAGKGLREFISGYDHWVVFGLLLFVGAKMIYEAFALKDDEGEKGRMSLSLLMLLSVATSIDALAVGMTFGLIKLNIILPVIIIGTVTFLLSLLGCCLGKKFGRFFESKIEVAGGLILIGIGIKILLEHVS